MRARYGPPWSSPDGPDLLGDEHRPIADTAHRRDVSRPIGIVAQLLAESPDVDVDRPVQRLCRTVAVERVEKRVPRKNAALGFSKRHQQAELRRGHEQRTALAAGFVAVAVDLHVTETQRLPWPAAAGPPQDRLHADDELGRRERPRQVVVGAPGDPLAA